MKFDLPKDQSSIIKVLGVGGGGSNAVNHMFHQGIAGVDFVVCNTDHQALDISPVPTKIQLGTDLTDGRGAGSKPEIGRNAAIESIDEVKELLAKNTKMVFITAGMGGGTGTGAAPIIAQAAKEMGILTVGIITMPFAFEGPQRRLQAEHGIEAIREQVDTLLVINNDRLRELYGNLPLADAFEQADSVLTTASKGIAEIITRTGYINVDFEDVRTVMTDSGAAIMGLAEAEGENRAYKAVEATLASPLLNDNQIRGARYVLLNITFGDQELLMDEISEITDYIREESGSTADVIWGYGKDESLGNRICVTIIATGFNSEPDTGADLERRHQKKVVNLEDDVPTVLTEPVVELDENNPEGDELTIEESELDTTNKAPLWNTESSDEQESEEDEFSITDEIMSSSDNQEEEKQIEEEPTDEASTEAIEQETNEGDNWTEESVAEEAEEEEPAEEETEATTEEPVAEEDPVEEETIEEETIEEKVAEEETTEKPVAEEITQEEATDEVIEEPVAEETTEASEEPITEEPEAELVAEEATESAPEREEEEIVAEETPDPVAEDEEEKEEFFGNEGIKRWQDAADTTEEVKEDAEEPVAEADTETEDDENTIEFDLTKSPALPGEDEAPEPYLKAGDDESKAEEPTEEPAKSEPVVEEEKEVSPVAQQKRATDRITKLKELSMKLRTPSGLSDLENEPAYKRKKVELDDTEHSTESEVSKYTLGESDEEDENGEKKTEIKPNNPFLHDNVD